MKKIVYALFIIFSFTILSCKKNNTELQSKIFETPIPTAIVKSETNTKKENSSSKIDFDFSKMNYNMISSITFEMLIAPENYENKTVKITGDFYSDEHEGHEYYFVMIWDPTGCCPAGISFIPTDSTKEKLSTLKQDEKVTVTGTMKLMQLEENTEDLILVAEKIDLGK